MTLFEIVAIVVTVALLLFIVKFLVTFSGVDEKSTPGSTHGGGGKSGGDKHGGDTDI